METSTYYVTFTAAQSGLANTQIAVYGIIVLYTPYFLAYSLTILHFSSQHANDTSLDSFPSRLVGPNSEADMCVQSVRQ